MPALATAHVGREHHLADVVVACLFAGVGAWGATVTVSPNPVYASELFGAGHLPIGYPTDIDPIMTGNQDGRPVVTLTIPRAANLRSAVEDNAGTPDVDESRDACPAVAVEDVNDDGSAEITFKLLAGVFDENVKGLMWETYDANNGSVSTPTAAPGTVATIESGGRKGDSSITILVKAATNDAATRKPASSGPVDYDATQKACKAPADRIYFEMPSLANLEALGGANSLDARGDNNVKFVWLQADSRLVSGSFSNGPLTSRPFAAAAPNFYAAAVITSRDALALTAAPRSNAKTIAIDDDAAKGLVAFNSVKEKNADGYVHLTTVTVEYLPHVKAEGKAAVPQDDKYRIRADAGTAASAANDDVVYVPAAAGVPTTFHTIYDLDGESIAQGLRGTLSVDAAGSRELFNEGDVLFIDYDDNGKMGAGEGIAIDGDTGTGDALSIDPRQSESFNESGKGEFDVYYMPGGKMAINHGATIKLTAMVDYSDPTAIDEAPAGSMTTLNFDGVNSEVMAYAIPHSANKIGDKGNVRVRCEQPAPGAEACRVFAECWDDMGNRGFGEAPKMIPGNNLMVADGAEIEAITGLEPMSRISCRVLSRGIVTVQQLTRDGNSGTLVNNTYVGDGNAGVMDIVDAAEARIMGQIEETH